MRHWAMGVDESFHTTFGTCKFPPDSRIHTLLLGEELLFHFRVLARSGTCCLVQPLISLGSATEDVRVYCFCETQKKKSETLEVEVVETDDDIDMEQLVMLWEERPLLWDKSLEESERQKQEQGCLERNLSGALSWI